MEYFYDEEGNLVKKREADGKVWEYTYYGNGMLQKVVRPDKSEVSFGYDAFGRRIEKCITGTGSEKAIRFLWDGNALLHEWEEAIDKADKRMKPLQRIEYQAEYVTKLSEKKEQEAKEKAARGEAAPESLVTWIFQDDFIPRARITKEGYSSIMTDYLGTPTEAYDEAGSLVWKRELDINGKVMPAGKDRYGKTMEEEGETGFIPFRFQGQYEDKETGLYYNRFRYYDPETGQYTQQDPIGLAGGNPTLYGYVKDTNIWVDPFGLIEDFNQAMKKVLEWLEDRGFRAEKPKFSRVGTDIGKPIGMQTLDEKIGFRVEFDDRSGAHINVWNRKEKGPHFKFDASEKTVNKIQRHYRCKGYEEKNGELL